METLSGYTLYKTLKMGDRFIWNNREYVVTSAQSDYDYKTLVDGRPYEFTCYIECVLAENGKGYMYLKNLDNDPSWAVINQIKPIIIASVDVPLVSEPYPRDTTITIDDALDLLVTMTMPVSPLAITIKHSRKSPITTTLPAPGQQRVIVYKVVKAARVTIGSLLGLRYGFIRLNGDKRVVKSKMQVNGSWSQWELL